MPSSRTLFIHSIYKSLHLLTPTSTQALLQVPPALATTSLFSTLLKLLCGRLWQAGKWTPNTITPRLSDSSGQKVQRNVTLPLNIPCNRQPLCILLTSSNLPRVFPGFWVLLAGGFPGGASNKEPTDQWGRHKRGGFDPWVGKIPWRRAQQPSSILAWRIPRTEEPGGLRWSVGSQRVRYYWSDRAGTHSMGENSQAGSALCPLAPQEPWRVGDTCFMTMRPMLGMLGLEAFHHTAEFIQNLEILAPFLGPAQARPCLRIFDTEHLCFWKFLSELPYWTNTGWRVR